MKRLYLTIDDSPSANTGNIVEFLDAQGIQALFFCRGDRMEAFPDAVDRILGSGHLLGAHGFVHKKASAQSIDEFRDDVTLLARRIEAAYVRNGLEPRKYFRFPYFDKGSDSFPCDPAKLTERQIDQIRDIMLDLRAKVVSPSRGQLGHKNSCQKILEQIGYAPCGIRDDVWDGVEELRNDRDVGASIVTADWKLLPRHRERYDMTVEKLCRKLGEKLQGDGTAIVLAHDYDDYGEAFSDFRRIVSFMRDKAEFLRLPGSSLRLRRKLIAVG